MCNVVPFSYPSASDTLMRLYVSSVHHHMLARCLWLVLCPANLTIHDWLFRTKKQIADATRPEKMIHPSDSFFAVQLPPLRLLSTVVYPIMKKPVDPHHWPPRCLPNLDWLASFRFMTRHIMPCSEDDSMGLLAVCAGVSSLIASAICMARKPKRPQCGPYEGTSSKSVGPSNHLITTVLRRGRLLGC